MIHVDTDVCEQAGFDVPRAGRDAPTLVTAVIERLVREMGPEFVAEHGHRVLFAVAVDATECWLLPLVTESKDAAKTTGCLERLNHLLNKQGQARVAHNDGSGKDSRRYADVAKAFRKPKVLASAAKRNPSLGVFLTEIANKT